MIVGSSTTSSQLEAGSIMVIAVKSIDEPSLPLRVYGPNRSTHRASQGRRSPLDALSSSTLSPLLVTSNAPAESF